MGQFEQLFESHKKKIDFKIVYIRDTHPVLGFRAPTNDRLKISPDLEPKSLADREKWACEDRKKMNCTIPIVVDSFDDKTLRLRRLPTAGLRLGQERQDRLLFLGPHRL